MSPAAPAPVTLTGFADEIAAAAGEQIAGLAACDLRWVEVRGVDGAGVLDLGDAATEAFRRRLDAAGIAVSCIGSPIGKVPLGSDLDEHFCRFQTALRRADQLGCRFVRLFSFYGQGQPPAAMRAGVVAQLARMAEAAGSAGITLLHENEKGIYGETPEGCLDLLESVASPHLKAAFDPANFVQCGCHPAAAWERLAGHVAYFHIKDAVAATGRVVPAGRGDGDLPAVLGAALAAGYSGFLSVEPHLQADDPEYGGTGAERFATAVTALRGLLTRLGAAWS